MDRYLLYTLIFCYLCIPWTDCGPLGISHRKLLQDPIPSDHDDGHLTDADVSHTGNDRPAGPGARSGHDHVAVGLDQTDQSLPRLSDSGGNGAADTVHSSDGQLVANEDHHSSVGLNGAGQDPDHAGQGQDDTLVGHQDLADDHGSAGQGHDDTLEGHQDLTDDHGSAGQTLGGSLVGQQDSADHGNVDHNTLGDASAVKSSGSVIHGVDSASDGASVSRDHSSAIGGQHSASEGHFSAGADQDSLVGHRSAVINHDDVHTLGGSASDHNSVSDSLINAQSNVNADSISGSPDTSGQSQSAISDHDSSLHHDSVVDSDHGIIDPSDNAIGTHNIDVASHQSASLDTHQNSVVHQDNIVSDLIDDSAQTDGEDDDDDDDEDDYDDADDYVIPDSVVNVQQNTLDGVNDRAVPIHSDAVAGHESFGPHNAGDLIASHNSNNDSDVLASQVHSDDDNKENSGSITSRVTPVHSESHLDGSGSSQSGQTSDIEGHVNAQSAHEMGGDSGLPIDLDISHLSGNENINGHGGHVSDHNPDMTGHVDAHLNPGAGVHVPDSGAENEGSGGQANPGDNNGTEHGNSSGDHESVPSHSLPPSHEGHEVHSDVIQGSGDGPVIDKDGGVHDLSHHENPEHEHIPPVGPRHSPEFTTTSSTPSGTTTQVKIVILPTPAQPEPVGGESITHRLPGGDEVEGSGSEGHLPIIPTTPNGGHEGQGHGNEGHLVALTTTPHENHEGEGSGSGSQGHAEGHEGEGHLPDEGSGDEHEGHEGSGSGSGDKPPKDQTTEEESKFSTVLLPSEAQWLQSSIDVFILPSLANSVAGFSTEKGPASLQITEIPIPQSIIVAVDSSERILTNSESADVHSSFTTALEFEVSSSVHDLLPPFAAESSIPHSTSSHSPSHSSVTIEPYIHTESILVNELTTPPLLRTSNVIRTSAIILENSSKFYFQSSSNLGITDVSITMKPSPFSETIYPTEVLRETKSRTDNLETISYNLRTPLLNSATVSPSFSSDITTDSSEVNEIDGHSTASDTLITDTVSTRKTRVSELIRESSLVKEMVSASRIQSVLSSVISSQATSAVPQYTTVGEPVSSSRPKSPVTSPTSTSTSLGTVKSSTMTLFTPTVASNSSRNVSQSTVGPFSSLSSNRTLGTLNASTHVTASSRGSTTLFLSIFTSSGRTSTIVSTPNGSLPVPGTSGESSSVSLSSKTTLSPLITTLVSTTKRKNISFNTSFPTSTTTSKKPTSPASKVEKPETLPVVLSTSRPRTSNISTGTSRAAVTERTTLSPIHAVKSTTRPESSTAPPVFVQVDLRMTWSEFCSDKSYFIADLSEIIHTEKQVLVEEERFIINFPSENCRMANYLQEESLMSTQIQIQVYIIDNKGRVDIGLTIDLSVVIEKGFKSLTSRFKDKFVGARLFGPPQGTSPPRLNSPGRNVQKSPGITMVTVIASVGGACCVILIILQVIMIRRRILQKKLRPFVVGQRASLQSMDHVALGVIPKSRPDSGYWNPALEQEEIPEPSPHSHLVNFAGLANFSLNKNGIYEEFQMIPFETPDKCEVPVGVEEKNRFANVLPFKATRVRLQKKEGEDNSEYINANFIKGYKKADDVYIATQSPMMNTAEDFWRMVWEKQSRVILMLNPLSDTGKPKMCTMYWPDGEGSECVKQFGDYAITLKKKDIQTDYIESTLQLRDMERNLKREIHHFWFTSWPETGLPEPLAFVKFVLDVRPRYEDTGTPVVVHCGPGTGRTGVLITVDVCMRMFEEKRRVDVLQCVHQMRKERAGTVQTRDQYALIYQALNEYAVILSSPSMSTRSSVITLHAML